MRHLGWRLERTFLAGAGLAESRLEGLDLRWSEPLDRTAHAALWADNGTGKTMVTALRYALYLPSARDFIRGESDRSLAQLVRSRDVCHVVEQASRVIDGELQRVVVGMVADWAGGGTQDLENPSRLHRVFYGWVSGEHGPTIDDLPFRTNAGRWATRNRFTDGVRAVLPSGGAVPPHLPSDHQGNWRRWLDAVGVDLDQVRFQAVMNAAEGGVDRVMRFTDSDQFVQWLVGATMPTSTVEQITNSVDVLRANAAARPRWEEELNLWQKLIEPLFDLAVAHDEAGKQRRAATAARTRAVSAVADAEATTAALHLKEETAKQLYDHHDGARREAGSAARRAQAHRLRMELRAAELRVREAEGIAGRRRDEREDAERELAAWRIVNDVLLAGKLTGRLAGLEERRRVVEMKTEQLQREEASLRHSIARLLTARRDEAETARRTAETGLKKARADLDAATVEEKNALGERGAVTQQAEQLEKDRTAAEGELAEVVEAGLLPEGEEPAQRDLDLAGSIAAAQGRRNAATLELERVETVLGSAQERLAAAQRQIREARDDVERFRGQLNTVDRRVAALEENELVVDAFDGTVADLWESRVLLTDVLAGRATRADGDAEEARRAAEAAQRTIDSIGTDGLLPPAEIIEDAVRRCEQEELMVWSGWRWIADTMTAEPAESFARSRPDIASGLVVAEPHLVPAVAAVLDGLDLDVALWVGAVTDPEAAAAGGGGSGTEARILLPPAGVFDRDAAAGLVAAATDDRARAEDERAKATARAQLLRGVLATCEQLWQEFPVDPRPTLNRSIEAAEQRGEEASRHEQTAQEEIAALKEERVVQRGVMEEAQLTIDTAAEHRRLLVPAIAAAETIAAARRALPGLRDAIASLGARIEELSDVKADLAERIEEAKGLRDERANARDDAANALRQAGLAPTTEGSIPDEGETVLQARLAGVRETLASATIDPALSDEIERLRCELADAEARIGTDRERWELAQQYAESRGARHPVALAESIRAAEGRSSDAGVEFATAEATAEAARRLHRQRVEDREDRASPDADGFPSAVRVTSPLEADQYARQLNDVAVEFLEKRNVEDRLMKEAEAAGAKAAEARRLIEVSVRPLRHLAAEVPAGRVFDDVGKLTEALADSTEELRAATENVSRAQDALNELTAGVQAHANGKDARAVEDRADPHLADLITRLRTDQSLALDAERIAAQLEQRAATLRDDLGQHDERVRTCARMLHIQASTAIEKLRHYQNQSRLPEGLGEWSGQRFAVIDHEPVPDDESVSVDRVARLVHALLAPGAGSSDAQAMLFAAARALVNAPFRVRLLKPHTDLALDRVDVAELKNFSGGQRVTAGVLLYATMARVKAAGNDTSIGWLWLDNPFGQASADQFVRTMRLAADKLGLQLVFTAAPKDKGALSMFDRIITLARRSRPSSGEKVVLVDDGNRELADLELIQHDVLQVLGE
ncbi:coiled-coil domain-containing protein [Amycolatopsis panacis]|uniref:Chromosome segregation ATPase n=1 Tax=Amycolatopsis panacis TaxID=2340917 RepID=A0A419IBY7_9PSEU|nr:hypothetical protein [Amycolatopsis panacis]RJQ92740.1 hypothetical protein D5S19_00295 [Amycolatopsis panacis]